LASREPHVTNLRVANYQLRTSKAEDLCGALGHLVSPNGAFAQNFE
jgi:hypothetical protein